MAEGAADQPGLLFFCQTAHSSIGFGFNKQDIQLDRRPMETRYSPGQRDQLEICTALLALAYLGAGSIAGLNPSAVLLGRIRKVLASR